MLKYILNAKRYRSIANSWVHCHTLGSFGIFLRCKCISIDLYFKNSMLRRETYIPKLFQGWSSWHPIVSQAPLFHLLTQKLLKGLHAPYLAAFCAAAPQSNKLLPEPLVDKLAVIAGAKELSPGLHSIPPSFPSLRRADAVALDYHSSWLGCRRCDSPIIGIPRRMGGSGKSSEEDRGAGRGLP